MGGAEPSFLPSLLPQRAPGTTWGAKPSRHWHWHTAAAPVSRRTSTGLRPRCVLPAAGTCCFQILLPPPPFFFFFPFLFIFPPFPPLGKQAQRAARSSTSTQGRAAFRTRRLAASPGRSAALFFCRLRQISVPRRFPGESPSPRGWGPCAPPRAPTRGLSPPDLRKGGICSSLDFATLRSKLLPVQIFSGRVLPL